MLVKLCTVVAIVCVSFFIVVCGNTQLCFTYVTFTQKLFSIKIIITKSQT